MATSAKYPSAKAVPQIAVGSTATREAARRAVYVPASSRTAITMAAAALDLTSKHSSPAQTLLVRAGRFGLATRTSAAHPATLRGPDVGPEVEDATGERA
ncbi:hypothetical protein A8144_01665 [Mycobacterium leprae 3125609]|uniref:Afp n=1 Tax=Mycobacterium leprae TaxID=1769 RepID=Q50169_MYCLR|nr:afp [Mycobacterium leprae]OAR21181.1 hypothetical protein A8144_01665 [Mycobacterium leprae 3125609]